MSTPIIEAIDNVNQTSLETVFAAVTADPTARDNLSQSDRNIDKVSTNAGLIKELDASEEAIRKILCRREGRDPANFADLDAVAAEVSLVQDLSLRDESIDIIEFSEKAHNALSGNDRATREFMCHPAELDATTFTNVGDLASDNTAMSTIAANAEASRTMSVLPLAMQEVAASQTAMQEVTASQTAMQEVAASQTAMQEVAASQDAMQEVIASTTATDEVVNSQTAMQEVAASQTALNEFGNNSTVQNTVYNNNTAVSALNSSNLVESITVSIQKKDDETLKDDRVILLSHSSGGDGSRSNLPQFGANTNSFPHTADRIRRNNNETFTSPTNTSASFIDISDS